MHIKRLALLFWIALVSTCTADDVRHRSDLASSDIYPTSFDCKSMPPQVVPYSQVEDGICDCCNGADEGTAVMCSDMCADRLALMQESLRKFAAAHRRGAALAKKRAKAYSAQFKRIRDTFTQEFKTAHTTFLSAHKQLETKARAFSARRPTMREYQQLQAFEQRVRQYQAVATQAYALAHASFGPGDIWMAALGSCSMSIPISEKLSKGGSRTSLPKAYAYSVCFAYNATQLEHLPDQWLQDDAGTRGGMVNMQVDGQGKLVQREFADPTVLGHFVGYLYHHEVDDHLWLGSPKYPGVQVGPTVIPNFTLALPQGTQLSEVAMLYLSNDECRSEDVVTTRRSYVIHVCPGASNFEHDVLAAMSFPSSRLRQEKWRAQPVGTGGDLLGEVVHVEEDGLCTYKLFVESVLACNTAIARKAEIELESISKLN